jgi:hypothetical protein
VALLWIARKVAKTQFISHIMIVVCLVRFSSFGGFAMDSSLSRKDAIHISYYGCCLKLYRTTVILFRQKVALYDKMLHFR